mgnify:CR=1 FL=1
MHEELLRKLDLPIVVIPIRISFLFNGAEEFDKHINEYVFSYFPILETKDDTEVSGEEFESDEDIEVEFEEIL